MQVQAIKADSQTRFGATIHKTTEDSVQLTLSQPEVNKFGETLIGLFGAQLDLSQPITVSGPRPQVSFNHTHIFLTQPGDERGVYKPGYAKLVDWLGALIAKPTSHTLQAEAHARQLVSLLSQVSSDLEAHIPKK